MTLYGARKIFLPSSLLMILACTILPEHTAAKVVFVDPRLAQDCTAGNYSIARRDGSGADGVAYRNFAQAFADASADTIYLRGETYTEPLRITRNGAPSAFLLVSNYAGEQVVLEGRHEVPQSNTGMIYLAQRSFVKLVGLTVRNSRCYGVLARSCSNIVIADCEIAFSLHGGVVCEGGAEIVLARSRVHHNNALGVSAWHEAVTFEGVQGFAVHDCHIFANAEEGIDAKYGAARGAIHHNQIAANHGPNVYIDAAQQIEIYSNTIAAAASAKPGIMLGIEVNQVQAVTHGIKIYNNLIYGNGAGLAFWLEDNVPATAQFYDIALVNNLFYENNKNDWGALRILNGSAENFGASLLVRNNLFWGNNGALWARTIRGEAEVLQRFVIEHNLFNAEEASNTYGTAAVRVAEVKFVNAAQQNFRLRGDSPARDAGTPRSAPAADFLGTPRPLGAGFDIGPYEFTNNDFAPPSPPRDVRVQK